MKNLFDLHGFIKKQKQTKPSLNYRSKKKIKYF